MKTLLIKPIIKAISSIATKLKNTAASKIAKNINRNLTTAQRAITKIDISKLTNLDILNITRSKYDKKFLHATAKSLNLTSRELSSITKFINDTQARKEAVQGVNFQKQISDILGKNKNIKNYLEDLNNKHNSHIQNPFLVALNKIILSKTNGKYSLSQKVLNKKKVNIDIVDYYIDEMTSWSKFYVEKNWVVLYDNDSIEDSDYIDDYIDRMENMILYRVSFSPNTKTSEIKKALKK
ncbi:MAG: hypothetical protein FWC41_00775 [Firmicutes bacterium]|nr:hypothetical protein [Bacillota bacterium]